MIWYVGKKLTSKTLSYTVVIVLPIGQVSRSIPSSIWAALCCVIIVQTFVINHYQFINFLRHLIVCGGPRHIGYTIKKPQISLLYATLNHRWFWYNHVTFWLTYCMNRLGGGGGRIGKSSEGNSRTEAHSH